MQFSNNLEPEATVVLPHRLLVEGNPANFVSYSSTVRLLTFACTRRCARPPRRMQSSLQDAGCGAVSGDTSQMSESFVKRWHKGITSESTSPRPRCSARRCRTSWRIPTSRIRLFQPRREGAKLTVLETIDFEAVRIDVFVIELDSHDLPKNWKITRLLHNLDYCE